MARLFSKLRGLMREYGDTQDDLARVLLLGRVSVSNRMRGASDWKLSEMCTEERSARRSLQGDWIRCTCRRTPEFPI